MKRLAIISSYHEACGIATYTERLEPVFRNYYEVDVLRLETEVLKSNNTELVSLGDSMINEIADKLRDYDYVNIQFEAGLYGASVQDVRRRIKILLNACKNVIVTFHSVNFEMPRLSLGMLISKHWLSNLRAHRNAKHWPAFYNWFIKEIKKVDMMPDRKASIIVHDNKTRRYITRAYKFDHIYAHPLGLSSARERSIAQTEQEKTAFNSRYSIESGEKTIGVFGFVSEYKGHMTALKALRHLPDKYTLLIFGAQHPASIQPFVPIDEYLDRLLNYIEECDAADQKSKKQFDARGNTVTKKHFSQRVQFVGDVNDEEFAQAMRCCDFVVLPYIEVKQMGSGIAALAIENHARSIFSNTKCFQELQQFFPNCFSIFDIGNYLQLAYNIEHYNDCYADAIDQALTIHNLEKNVQEYVDVFEGKKAASNDE